MVTRVNKTHDTVPSLLVEMILGVQTQLLLLMSVVLQASPNVMFANRSSEKSVLSREMWARLSFQSHSVT